MTLADFYAEMIQPEDHVPIGAEYARDIPNTLGWPIEQDGNYRLIWGADNRLDSMWKLLLDDHLVGTWGHEFLRWFTPEEEAAVMATEWGRR